MRAYLLIVCFAFAALSARAEDLPAAPGWSMARITEQAQEENVYGDARVYFSLKPPDARAAISIDSATADSLRSGNANAEAVYSGQSGPKKEDEEFVYGTHGNSNGIQVADAVNSTLTADEGRKDPAPVATANAPHSLAGGGGGLAGFSGSGLSSDAGRATAAKALAMQTGAPASSTGASSPPPAAATDSAGGSAAMNDPRQIASLANGAAPVDTAVAATMQVNNVAAGFGMSSSTSTDTNFSVWPNGNPSTATVACTNATLTFNSPTLQRISVPAGCKGVKIDAFGAGGGLGGSVGDDGTTTYSADGGGAAFVHTEGLVDSAANDLSIVVGSSGGDAKAGVAGEPGFVGGGAGGAGGGGGGGGYSGVFLVDKAQFHAGEAPQLPGMALAVAAGGGGGSALGSVGGAGGVDTGGGALGATKSRGGLGQATGSGGFSLKGGRAGPLGGGGGGGYYGGGAGVSDGSTALGGGGGSSYVAFPGSASTATAGSGATAGNAGYANRNNAGNAGKAGLVVVTFY